MQDIPEWEDGEATIASVLQRMCEIMAPDGDEARIRDLQALADKVLDQRPVATVMGLEHRLTCLRDALETLGPWAEPRAIVDLALEISHRLH